MISIICPIYNEEKYIANCIESLLLQDIDKENIEILFIDGMSTDRTRMIVSNYSSDNPFIRCLDNPDRIVPKAMNIGIQEAKGNIIIRIDAHASYATNYISTLVQYIRSTDADNVGAPCKTDVLNKTPIALAIKAVLRHPFGIGNSQFRIGVKQVMSVDTVPFGCWRRDVFERFGMYDERLVRNQDIELNKRIIRGGGKILLVPETECIYFARETITPLIRNNYQNGFWNIKTVFFTKQLSSLSLRHFIPLFFVLGLLLPTLLSFIYFPFLMISALTLLLYSIVAIYFSITIKKKSDQISLYNLYKVFISLHISYGCGSLVSLIKLPFAKR